MEAEARARAGEVREQFNAGNMSRAEAEHEIDSLETFADEIASETARAAAAAPVGDVGWFRGFR